MNIRHYIKENVYVYFAYETWDGWDKFGNYDEALPFNLDDDGEPLQLFLCGYLVNDYNGTCERILEKRLCRKPTYSQAKSFILACYDCVA